MGSSTSGVPDPSTHATPGPLSTATVLPGTAVTVSNVGGGVTISSSAGGGLSVIVSATDPGIACLWIDTSSKGAPVFRFKVNPTDPWTKVP